MHRLVWLIGGIALLWEARNGLRPHSTTAVLAEHVVLGLAGAALSIYALRSAVRLFQDGSGRS